MDAKKSAKASVIYWMEGKLRQLNDEINKGKRDINNLAQEQEIRKRARNVLCTLINNFKNPKLKKA